MPVALSRDVPAGTTRAVRLDGEELVVWRSEAGEIRVFADRCPHRGMRLSLGFVRGERLACLYHGWEYGLSGSCQRIPAHPDLSVPATIRVAGRQVAESGGLVLVSSDPEAVAPELESLVPLATTSVMADAQSVAEAADGDARGLLMRTAAFGVPLHIGWHAPRSDRTMIHALVTPDTPLLPALDALHALRAAAESRRMS